MSEDLSLKGSFPDIDKIRQQDDEYAAYCDATEKQDQLTLALSNLACVPFVTSLPYKTPADKVKALSHKGTWTNGINMLKAPHGFRVHHFVLFHTTYTNQDGEQVSGPCMVLINDSGESCRIGAYYLIKQILEFVNEYGIPPYLPPVTFRVTDVILPNNNRTYQLHTSIE